MTELQNVNIDEVLTGIRTAIRLAQNEEEVRIRVSKCIEDKVLKPLGIDQVGHYEYTLISGARIDALYGHVIIEYKAPGKLSARSDVAKAKEQIIRYIMEEAKVKERYRNFLGVIISDRIAFVRYSPREDAWLLRGPYDITRETVIKLVEAIRGLQRKSLVVDTLIRDFGPDSPIAKKTVRLLYERLIHNSKPRVMTLFSDWKRIFTQATGYSPEKLKRLKSMAREYGISGHIDFDALLFSVHTYYALLMKLLAAEIAYLYGQGRWLRSYVAELENAYLSGGVDSLKQVLSDLESGGIFTRLLNIVNFVEGDYFSWYLDELDKELGDAIAEIARRLTDYEPATPHLEPESARDLLKRLYQYLIPRDIRHSLGEYYTPDWLAELILNEVGLTKDALEEIGKENPLKPLEIRVLDPACGSGTFLIMYLKRLRDYAEEHFLIDEMINYVLKNVVGYDLNPLAVLAARTNYLLTIGDLLTHARGQVEIPVYLADSILVETKSDLRGQSYVLRTTVGNFEIPKSIVDKGILSSILQELSLAVKNRYTSSEFKQMVQMRYNLDDVEADSMAILYDTFLKLEIEGRNHVWIAIIRNAFAPILNGKFDYVVGNPPWVAWENLPEDYRKITSIFWGEEREGGYGLIGGGAGRFKRDLAMLFLARCLDLYVKENGKLGFLMPFTVFKTQAGAGFRKFLSRWCINHIHDLVTLYPFEGATNRASAIVVSKTPAESRDIRIRHTIWINPTMRPFPTDAKIEEVIKTADTIEGIMMPVKRGDASSPWAQLTPKIINSLNRFLGLSNYKAHAGVYTSLNQVYYIDILDKTAQGVLITNPVRSRQKKRVKVVRYLIEPDLVYPMIKGEDVKKWYVKAKFGYILVPHNPTDGTPINIIKLKSSFPKTYQYLNEFVDDLIRRTIKPFLGIRQKMKRAKSEALRRQLLKDLKSNFYILDNIGEYTFSPYKVVWKRISGAITGKAVSFASAVIEPLNDKWLGMKPVIPDDSLILVPCNSVEEAYYLAGVLNSTPIKFIIASYTYELRQETHILEFIRIPKYEGKKLQNEIAALSKKAHQIAKEIYEERKDYLKQELREVEGEIDRLVARLYDISDEELLEIKRAFAILAGEEIEEVEIQQEEIPKDIIVEFPKTVLMPDVEENLVISLMNPKAKPLKIEIKLPDGESKKFKTSEKEKVIEIGINPLPPGEYDVRYKISLEDGSIIKEDKVKIKVQEIKRFRR